MISHLLKCSALKLLPHHAPYSHELPKTSHVMQMNNHQCSSWSHYTDYKTQHFTVNPGSAYIKMWSHYCTALVHTPTLYELLLLSCPTLFKQPISHQAADVIEEEDSGDVCVSEDEDEPHMDLKGGMRVSAPDPILTL